MHRVSLTLFLSILAYSFELHSQVQEIVSEPASGPCKDKTIIKSFEKELSNFKTTWRPSTSTSATFWSGVFDSKENQNRQVHIFETFDKILTKTEKGLDELRDLSETQVPPPTKDSVPSERDEFIEFLTRSGRLDSQLNSFKAKIDSLKEERSRSRLPPEPAWRTLTCDQLTTLSERFKSSGEAKSQSTPLSPKPQDTQFASCMSLEQYFGQNPRDRSLKEIRFSNDKDTDRYVLSFTHPKADGTSLKFPETMAYSSNPNIGPYVRMNDPLAKFREFETFRSNCMGKQYSTTVLPSSLIPKAFDFDAVSELFCAQLRKELETGLTATNPILSRLQRRQSGLKDPENDGFTFKEFMEYLLPEQLDPEKFNYVISQEDPKGCRFKLINCKETQQELIQSLDHAQSTLQKAYDRWSLLSDLKDLTSNSSAATQLRPLSKDIPYFKEFNNEIQNLKSVSNCQEILEWRKRAPNLIEKLETSFYNDVAPLSPHDNTRDPEKKNQQGGAQ